MTESFLNGVKLEQSDKTKVLGHKAKVLGHKAKVLGHKAKVLGHKAKVLGHKAKVSGHKAKVLGHKAKVLGHKAKVLGHIFNKQNNNMAHIKKKEEETIEMMEAMGRNNKTNNLDKMYMVSMVTNVIEWDNSVQYNKREKE